MTASPQLWADIAQVVALALALAWLALLAAAVRARGGDGGGVHPGVLVGTGIAAVLFAAQAWLADLVVDDGSGPTAADAAVTGFTTAHRSPALTLLARGFDLLAGELPLTALAAVVTVMLFVRGHRRHAVVVAVGTVVGDATVAVAKAAYGRPRPPEAGRLIVEDGFSLPSGHALTSTVVIGLLTVVACAFLRTAAARAATVAAAVTVVAVGGAARVYLGVHWASDVVAGWTLGGAWVAIGATVLLAGARVPPSNQPAAQGASSR